MTMCFLRPWCFVAAYGLLFASLSVCFSGIMEALIKTDTSLLLAKTELTACCFPGYDFTTARVCSIGLCRVSSAVLLKMTYVSEFCCPPGFAHLQVTELELAYTCNNVKLSACLCIWRGNVSVFVKKKKKKRLKEVLPVVPEPYLFLCKSLGWL